MIKIKKDSKILFFVSLLIFSLLEVATYKENGTLITVISIIEYVFCFVILLFNERKGIKLFISFSLLSLGVNNFFVDIPPNFWGLRLGGISFNIVFSIILSLYVLGKNIRKIKFSIKDYPFYKFLILFFTYSFIIGLFSLINNINYQDNFVADVMTYFPFFIYFPLIYQLSYKDCEEVFIYTFLASVFMLWFAYFGDKTYQYGNTNYLVQNTIGNIILITSILIRKNIGNIGFFFSVISLLFFSISGDLFISGKMWIIFIIYFLMLGLQGGGLGNIKRLLIILTSVFIIIQKDFIFDFLINFFEGNTIAFKLQQIKMVTNVASFAFITGTETSIGNVIAEIKTAYYYFSGNFMMFLFGEGFGGGIPDEFGVLKKWVNLLGYNPHDLPRNNFYKMHLPLTEMFVKGGLFLLFFYLSVFRTVLKSKSNYAILFFFMYIMFFYVSKESLLYSMLIYKLIFTEDTSKRVIEM